MEKRFTRRALCALTFLIAPLFVWAQETSTTTEESTAEVAQVATIVREQIQDVGDQKDFVVGPGRIELEVAPGTSEIFELTITNRLGVDKDFAITLEDIAGSEDPAQAVVLLGSDAGPNSLRDLITLPTETIAIAHGERVRVPVTVTLPADAGPTGRYGSVVVSVTSDANPANTGASSAIVSRIGTLVFVTTPGEVERQGNLEKFAVIGDKTWLKKGPVNFGILFRNSGNTHLNPYGEIRIFNMLNQEVGREEIPPWYVLPNAARLREIAWEKEPVFGRYTAVLSLYNGYENTPITDTYTFYVVSWWSIALLVLLAVGLVWLLSRRTRARK